MINLIISYYLTILQFYHIDIFIFSLKTVFIRIKDLRLIIMHRLLNHYCTVFYETFNYL